MYSFQLSDTEVILKKDHASMAMENQAYNGALYLTNERLVFIGYLMDIRNKYMEEILFYQIAEIKPEKSLYIVPNAIAITTSAGRKIKFVVKQRDAWIDKIKQKIEEFA